MKRIRTKTRRKTRTQGKRKTNKTRKHRGGGEKEQKQRVIKDNFRNMFMKSFKKLIDSIKSGNASQLTAAIESFKNGFKSNQIGINTLIPITNKTIPIYKQNNSAATPIIGFVPLLVVIFDNIDDLITRKVLINSFIQNKGNINLKSYIKNITALSEAIHLQDKELIKYLLQNGADIKLLTDEQKDTLDSLIKETEIVEIIEPEPNKPVIKLNYQIELPSESGYDNSTEPDFWKPIFAENEMLTIRQKINEMMNADNRPLVKNQNNEITNLWSVCQILQAMIPTYYIPNKNEPYESFGSYLSDLDVDFSQYNIILCASLILFGIISHKMVGQDYSLIFKGGKAIQLVLAGIQEATPYKTEDIDVLLLPDINIPYNETIVKNISGHIAYLVRWFFDPPYKVSVQAPNPKNIRANPFLFKLSYVKVNPKSDFRKKIMVEDFKQFSDIDFKEMPENIKVYFEKSIEYPFFISELNETVLFRCPNIGSLLDEKMYYYIKYFEFKKMLEERKPITERGYESITVVDCYRFLEKFKRAILALNTGLQKQRNPGITPDELLIKERNSISTRVDKLTTNPEIKTQIVESLYRN
jgi:hypothetical protein